MSSRFVSLALCGLLLASGVFISPSAHGEVQYVIKAKTYDRVRATVFVPQEGYLTRNVRMGSFGAPTLNDKGTVGFACILSGSGLSVDTNRSVITRMPGKKRVPVVAVQSGPGSILSDSFLPGQGGTAFAISRTARMYSIGINVALNNNNRIAFTGEMLYGRNSGGEEPVVTTESTAVYGVAIPLTKRASSYRNWGLVMFNEYYDEILTEPVSLNINGSVAYDGDFFYTTDKSAPGIAFSSQNNGAVIATTQATVIGLPYFTTFQSFSYPIISNDNVAYLVADISDEGDEFDGIWRGNNPNLQPVVVKETDAPGGGLFATFGGQVGVSNNGLLCAFTATLSDADVSGGVFRINSRGRQCIRIAAVGEPAPGNEYVSRLGAFTSIDLAAASNNGRVAFKGTAPGPRGNALAGIWVTDRDGKRLSLVVREGQTIKVGGVEKKVINIAYNPIYGLNRKGEVAFTASFNDRTSAVIVASVKELK